MKPVVTALWLSCSSLCLSHCTGADGTAASYPTQSAPKPVAPAPAGRGDVVGGSPSTPLTAAAAPPSQPEAARDAGVVAAPSGRGAVVAPAAGPGAAGGGGGSPASTTVTRGAGPAGGAAMGTAGVSASGGRAPVCARLPRTDDYAMPGPFADAKMFAGVGPNANYHLFRPDASLGMGGFKHPIATWGNGIATTPEQYRQTLTLVATHGFVIIACNDTQAERACLADGLDWLIEQDAAEGVLRGQLDTSREVAIGYSWGGGAAIDTSDRTNIKATVSLHGMPPRGAMAFEAMHSPLLLFTSTGDSFVTASGYVTPNYEKSKVPTFYATLDDGTAGHLYVADRDATACVASAALGECRGAEAERAPLVAWLRYWVCDDAEAKRFFFGDDCVLCKSPWTMPQRKLWQ